jgi:putative aminopeptidase FrvX
MTDITPFLKSLISTVGLSGNESPAAELIAERWRPLADEVHLSRLGSVHALRRGDAPAPRSSLLVSAHMDAVGMMVTGIEDGFLRLTDVGGVDPRLLPGQSVLVHARQPLPGVIAARPVSLMPEDTAKAAIGFDHLLVDVGLPPRRVRKLVRVGDLVSFANDPLELGAGILSGHSLDNRASVAALTLSLEAMQAQSHAWDVWFAATVQEEINLAGGATSAFALRPDLAIVVDVTFAKGPGANGWEMFPLGGGPTLGIGPHIHPFLLKHLRELAEKLEIPFAVEPMPDHSGTEADTVQLTAAGVPTAVVSIPIRYMHTPVEVAALKDIQRAGRLVAEFAAGLEADFLDRVIWDD